MLSGCTNVLALINMVESATEIPGLALAAVTVDRVGRKLSMATIFFLCDLFLLPLLFHQSESFTIVLLFVARICIKATFVIVFIYGPEVDFKFILHLFSP